MDAQTRAQVQERAENRCEYCQLHQEDSPLAPLHVEHIRPKIHGGTDELDNLALACIDCNLHKGPNLTGIDPKSNQVTELFHPRQHRWTEHFEWRGHSLGGQNGYRPNDDSPSPNQLRRSTRTAFGLIAFLKIRRTDSGCIFHR